MQKNKTKVLYVDIEATNLSANFGYILCIGYKWGHKKKAEVVSISDFKRFKLDVTNDIEVLKKFEKVYDKADVVIFHYGDRYDLPYIQARRLIQGLRILPTTSTIDTWKIIKYKLALSNNKLDTLIKTLGTPTQKTPLTGPIWVKAAAGHKPSIKYIKKHCLADVYALEEAYLKIRGLMTNHPKVGNLGNCPICDSPRVKSHGIRLTAQNRYRRRRCLHCGFTYKGEKL